jgi:hypothetical protein|tara:strand:- start:107452 stop:108075 length:624 start_codon:yes stop_codon:yes gene_type:complete
MKYITSLLCVLCCTVALAQKDMASLDTQVVDFTTKLESRNIDVYFTTTRYCNGDIQMFVMPDGSKCFSKGAYAATYIVWEEDDETRIKKMDNCGAFASVALDDNNLFNYFKENVKDLQNNKVKPYEIAQTGGGPIQRTEIEDCHRKYKFVDEATEGTQEFKPFDLTNSAREQNTNHEYNQALAVTTLEGMMDKAIAALESNAGNKRL